MYVHAVRECEHDSKCELCSQFSMFMLSESESTAVNVNYVARECPSMAVNVNYVASLSMFMLSESESKVVNVNYAVNERTM